MKTNKLNLNNLKVESFVTSLEGKSAQSIKAGSSPLCGAAAFEVTAAAVLGIAATAGIAVGAAVAVSVIATNKKK